MNTIQFATTDEILAKFDAPKKHLSGTDLEKHGLRGKTLDEILRHPIFLRPSTLEECEYELKKAKQGILDWVDKEIIGENNMEKGDALSRFQIESVNVFREEQRQKLQKLKEI